MSESSIATVGASLAAMVTAPGGDESGGDNDDGDEVPFSATRAASRSACSSAADW